MKLHLTTAENNYLITGYGENYVEINKQRYTRNIIVMADQLTPDWTTEDFTGLSENHFSELIKLEPEVVLLGTGKTHQFLHPKIVQSLTKKNIPLECMTTAAACRTYNILMSEGRKVAAALMV
jgi:uncharacterized protein